MARRQRSQLPTCYYEGYLEKRSFKDKTSRKLWACLCGSSLFFFNEKRDADYVEKIDLCGFVSLSDDSSQDRNLDAARFNLVLKDGSIKITAPNAEARELWKGFILSVAELYVPSTLNLLPGQIHMLRQAVEKEQERIRNLPSSNAADVNPYVSIQADMPACYHRVSRPEAELLLEREAKRGNLLLRPGSDGNFAITTRQNYDGSIFRHYRVTRKHTGGFTIVVDDPVHCATLHDMIAYLVETTDGVLTPLVFENHYDKDLSVFRPDNESGEVTLQKSPPDPVPPTPPPKPAVPKMPTPEPKAAPVDKLSSSLNESVLREMQSAKQDSSALLPETRPPKKPVLPPSPAPRKTILPSSTNIESKIKISPDPQRKMPDATLSELKLKLGQKAKN